MLKGADAVTALLAKTRCVSPAPDPKRRHIVNEQMNKWMDEWMSGWVNERMNEWTNERMNEWMNAVHTQILLDVGQSGKACLAKGLSVSVDTGVSSENAPSQ